MCANNVFAHADNITDIVIGKITAGSGWCVCLWVSYVPDIIDNFVLTPFIRARFAPCVDTFRPS